MPENFANRYQTTLAAGVAAGDLTGTVTTATGAPAVPFRAIISAEGANTDEIVLVTNRVGTTLTWTRAAEAIAGVQAASAHASGATFTAILTAAGIADMTDISALPAAAAAAGTNELAINEAGTSKKLTVAQIRAYALSGSGSGLLVAGVGASTKAKDASDYVCDGTADEVQILDAVAALTGGVGSVRILGPAFTIADTLAIPSNVSLKGDGRGATTITGVAGMTAGLITMGALDSEVSHLKVLIPTSLTSDAIVWAVESVGNVMRDLHIVAPIGSSASIWGLFAPSAYEFHLQRIKVDTYTKGVRIANTNGLYNTGDAHLADVFVRIRAASTTALEVAGYEGTPGKNQNSISFFRVTAAGMAAASQVGLHIKNAARLVFEGLNVEGVVTSLEIAGAVGGGGPTANIVFVGAYATGAINLNANTHLVSFVGGRLTGIITDNQPVAASRARFYAGASVNGSTPIAEPWEASIPTLPLNLFIGVNPVRSVVSSTWPTANKAWYIAFQVNRAVTVSKAIIEVGNVHAGHCDIGIYSAAGALLATTGSIDMSAWGSYAQTQNAFAGAATVALVPGTLYYASLVVDNNTDKIAATTSLATGESDVAGTYAKAQTSAFPLPATATFGTGSCITPYIEFRE